MIYLSARDVGKLPGAGDVILIAVGLENVLDLHAFSLSDVDIDLTVPPWIHYYRLSLGADEV